LPDGFTGGWMPDRPAILQISRADIGGGAARVAWDLFHAYQARGYPAWLAVGIKRTKASGVLVIPNEDNRSGWARGCRRMSEYLQRTEAMPYLARPIGRAAGFLAGPVRYLARARGREDFDFPGTRRILSLPPRRPDLLHAHNLHRLYFDLRVLPRLSHCLPVLLTLHDAWLLSGHCAHSLGCERWKSGCGACPDLSLYPEIARDATAYNWKRKREIFRHSRLYVATSSRWLMAKVEQSILAPAVQEARVIPNGVDLRQFRPGDRREARAKLGLPEDAILLLTTGTRVTDNVWKDYPTLKEAARIVGDTVSGRQVILLVLGDASPDEPAGAAQVQFRSHEDDLTTVARYYHAADVYVHAARADTFPLSVLEALACGTPTVATAVGGIVEQIVDGETGFLVAGEDPGSLAGRVIEILRNKILNDRLSVEATRVVRERFNLDFQVDSYLRWYSALTERARMVEGSHIDLPV
jgi:glycosyltransferase involved in cell wall biosynthesis